jgi:hypothetical protein
VSERAESTQRALAEGFGETEGASLQPLVSKLGELRFHRRFLEEVSAIEDELAPRAS